MFVTGPEVVKTVTKEEVSSEVLGGAKTHTSKSGVAHLSFDNDIVAISRLRTFIDFLPLSNKQPVPTRKTNDPRNRIEPSLDEYVPLDPNKPHDMKEVILKIVDEEDFFEIMPDYAKNILVGFARMEGKTVGIVANQPQELAGCLDNDSSIKRGSIRAIL